MVFNYNGEIDRGFEKPDISRFSFVLLAKCPFKSQSDPSRIGGCANGGTYTTIELRLWIRLKVIVVQESSLTAAQVVNSC